MVRVIGRCTSLIRDTHRDAATHVLGLARKLVEPVLRERVGRLPAPLAGPDRRRTTASATLTRYLDNYATMIRGSLDWSLRCERYRKIDGEDEAITFSHHELTDPPPDTGPLPYPAIRWWWQV